MAKILPNNQTASSLIKTMQEKKTCFKSKPVVQVLICDEMCYFTKMFLFLCSKYQYVSSNIENGSHEVNVPQEWTLN